jgi:hypothetical protein
VDVRLFLTPHSQYRERSRKQGQAANRQTGIDLRGVWVGVEDQRMCGSACAKRQTQHHECILYKTLRHLQILSGFLPKDLESSSIHEPKQVGPGDQYAFSDSNPMLPG